MPDGSKHAQTVPDGKYLCPDRPRRKLPMSRLSCVHVQTFVRSPDFRAFLSRLRAFTRLSSVHVQTFVRSPDFRAFLSRLSCVHQIYLLSPGFSALMSRLLSLRQFFVSICSYFRAFTRFSFNHRVFVPSCPDFCALIKQKKTRIFLKTNCVLIQKHEIESIILN